MDSTQIELDWLKRWRQYAPDACALKDGETGRRWSYEDLFKLSRRGANLLREKFGVKKGDRVAVFALNELETIALFFALQRLGGILVPINYRLTSREADHILNDCAPVLLLDQTEFRPLTSSLKRVQDGTTRLLSLTGGSDSFASLLGQDGPLFEDFEGEFEDPCMIIYTSGTTGAPKGALLSQRMLFWNSINTSLRLNLSQNDVAVIFLPLFHTGGWNVLTTPFLHRGACIILLKKFDADLILRLSEEEKATLLFGVPTTMEMMSRSSRFESRDLGSVRYAIVGGEPMPLDLIQTWHRKGIPIRQGYGLTEFGPNVFSLNEQDALRKMGSIGFPNFYVQAQIWDEQGQALGAQTIGELVLKGPLAMTGYWGNEAATQESFHQGWLRTGDLVRRDEDGFYFVVGRKKDMYKSGGENVYPAEVEQVLLSHPDIREAAVIGVPDSKWGEVGKAFLVLENPKADLSEIQSFCLKHLAKFKVPQHFAVLAELPKGDSGKILKRQLR